VPKALSTTQGHAEPAQRLLQSQLHQPAYPQGKAEEWTQNFILDANPASPKARSVSVWTCWAVFAEARWRQRHRRYATAADPRRRPADNFGRLGVALKAKVSKTELKVGEWMPVLPILRSDDGRSLPQTFRGGQITSNEINGLTSTAGSSAATARATTRAWKTCHERPRRVHLRPLQLRRRRIHLQRQTHPGRRVVRRTQRHLPAAVRQPEPQPAAGRLDPGRQPRLLHRQGRRQRPRRRPGQQNRVRPALSAKYGGNTFYVGLQKLTGDDAWMRVNGTSGGTLANDSYNSSYDNAKERSWQVRHDYNFVALGVPGLTLMNRYISGDNVHTGTITDGKEWGRESELAYTVQSGPLKNLNVKWRNASIRRDFSTNEFDENRIFISYPISLL
jgi:hypothetical protein